MRQNPMAPISHSCSGDIVIHLYQRIHGELAIATVVAIFAQGGCYFTSVLKSVLEVANVLVVDVLAVSS